MVKQADVYKIRKIRIEDSQQLQELLEPALRDTYQIMRRDAPEFVCLIWDVDRVIVKVDLEDHDLLLDAIGGNESPSDYDLLYTRSQDEFTGYLLPRLAESMFEAHFRNGEFHTTNLAVSWALDQGLDLAFKPPWLLRTLYP